MPINNKKSVSTKTWQAQFFGAVRFRSVSLGFARFFGSGGTCLAGGKRRSFRTGNAAAVQTKGEMSGCCGSNALSDWKVPIGFYRLLPPFTAFLWAGRGEDMRIANEKFKMEGPIQQNGDRGSFQLSAGWRVLLRVANPRAGKDGESPLCKGFTKKIILLGRGGRQPAGASLRGRRKGIGLLRFFWSKNRGASVYSVFFGGGVRRSLPEVGARPGQEWRIAEGGWRGRAERESANGRNGERAKETVRVGSHLLALRRGGF